MVFFNLLHDKVQHCKSRGVLDETADLECSGCSSVKSCRSAAAAITCHLPTNAGHLVPLTRPGISDQTSGVAENSESQGRPK